MFSKKYLKTKKVCKVTFRLLKKQIGPVDSVNLVGDFNNWSQRSGPMKKLKSGDFSLVVDLSPERAYEFRYLVDHHNWINDDDADAYLPSPYPGVDNSVIAL